MAWQEILKATSEAEAREAKPAIADIPAGTEVQINIDLPWYAPAGKLADLAGTEFWAQKLYSEVQVTDVEGDWHYIIIRGRAKGVIPVAIALIVFGVLAVIGLATFATVTIFANITEQQKIAGEREAAKIDFIKTYEPIYGEKVFEWVEGISTPPAGISLPDILKPAAIGTGVILLIALGIFLFMGRKK